MGGEVIRAPELMHGKTSRIGHTGRGIFRGLNSGFEATRYHSLIVRRDTLPEALEVTAETDDGLVMGLQHRTRPLYGVQFHPESIASENGHAILQNFLDISRDFNARKAA
jgi:anthranilate synthase component 2